MNINLSALLPVTRRITAIIVLYGSLVAILAPVPFRVFAAAELAAQNVYNLSPAVTFPWGTGFRSVLFSYSDWAYRVSLTTVPAGLDRSLLASELRKLGGIGTGKLSTMALRIPGSATAADSFIACVAGNASDDTIAICIPNNYVPLYSKSAAYVRADVLLRFPATSMSADMCLMPGEYTVDLRTEYHFILSDYASTAPAQDTFTSGNSAIKVVCQPEISITATDNINFGNVQPGVRVSQPLTVTITTDIPATLNLNYGISEITTSGARMSVSQAGSDVEIVDETLLTNRGDNVISRQVSVSSPLATGNAEWRLTVTASYP